MSEFAGMSEQLDDGTWRRVDDDPALAPGVLQAQRLLQQEAAQAKVRARLEAVDGELAEDAARWGHLADRLQEVDDFERAMLAAAREDTE